MNFSQNSIGPWMVAGDFNVVAHEEEKLGRGMRHRPAVEEFNAFITLCGLHDPGFQGNQFTWCGGGRQKTWCRLDRVLINSEFVNDFPQLRVQHLPSEASDHCPLLVSSASSHPVAKP